MAKVKSFDPFEDLKKLAGRMEQDFFELVTGRMHVPAAVGATWKPPLDIYELENEIIIKLELAGVKRKEISIVQEGNRIRISGSRNMGAREQIHTYHQMEINYGEFERVIVVSDAVRIGEVKATYRDGFLIIRAQKRPAEVAVGLNER
ncbi:MAG TPA: Hsp20/alpha crystallin family protein [Syntrophorhabdales bacterium]|nr:Hsp20/alpha crystallin family protein [Syntrophorhabdales bacterium]